jgi:glycosyltransferase involved in cell wall biosynthesis
MEKNDGFHQHRYVGHDLTDILWVSSMDPFHVPENAIKVPETMSSIPDIDLMQNYTIRDAEIVPKQRKPSRVAVISVYGINCGIATYTKYLCDAMQSQVKDLIILAEYASVEKDEDHVFRCWSRTNSDFTQLIEKIEQFNPDLIIIQHEFGLFPKLNTWNTLICQLSKFRIAVTFHTVLEHDVPSKTAQLDYLTRFLAEAPCRELIVHTPRARATLRNRGFSGSVHYIPHGCFSPQKLEKLPITKYGMMPEHIIFQYGFGGPHKGWEFAIETIDLLVKKYPDIIYIGIFNVSHYNQENTIYYRSLIDLIRKKKLEKNVVIHRGYQSEETLKLYIRSSRIAMFPYQTPNKSWASWGASGAIQLPLSLGIPVILSDFPAFMEFEGTLPIVRNYEQAASEIDHIFSDAEYEKKLSSISFQIAKDREWNRVSEWYLSIRPDEDFNAPIERIANAGSTDSGTVEQESG